MNVDPGDTFLFVPGRDPGKLLVLFSAANAERFSLFKVLEEYEEYDKLFIRDPYKQNWFQTGLGPHAPTPDAIAERILESRRSQETKIYSAGVSMGGFASLLFSSLGEFHAALAISPQTRLSPGFFRNPPRTIDVPYPDAAKMMADNPVTKYLILVGNVDWIDNYSISLLPDAPNVRALTFPRMDHALPVRLDKKFGMGAIIRSFVEDREFDFGPKVAPFDHKKKWIPALQEAAALYYERRLPEALEVLEKQLEKSTKWIGGIGFVARIHMECGRNDDAERYWLKALELNPKVNEPHLRLAKLYQERGLREKAAYHYRRLVKVRGRGRKDITATLRELEGMM